MAARRQRFVVLDCNERCKAYEAFVWDTDATTVELSLPLCFKKVNETTAGEVGKVLGICRVSALAINPIQHTDWSLERNGAPGEQRRNCGDLHAYHGLHSLGNEERYWLYGLPHCLVEKSQRTCTLISSCFEILLAAGYSFQRRIFVLPFFSWRTGSNVYNLVVWGPLA